MAVFFAAVPACWAAKTDIYLTSKSDDGVPLIEPANAFSCNSKIYTVAEFEGVSEGLHEFEVRWIDPGNKQRERTRYQFHTSGDTERLWAWLKLHQSTAASLASFIDPSIGMGDFIGDWTIKVFIDGKPIGERQFKVVC